MGLIERDQYRFGVPVNPPTAEYVAAQAIFAAAKAIQDLLVYNRSAYLKEEPQTKVLSMTLTARYAKQSLCISVRNKRVFLTNRSNPTRPRQR